MGKSLGNIFRSYIVPLAIGAVTGGLGYGPASAISLGAQGAYAAGRTAVAGGNLGQSLKAGALGAGGAYLGSQVGGPTTIGQAAGSAANTIGGAGASNTLANFIGNAASSTGTNLSGSFLGNALSTPISGIGGAIAGNSLSSSLNPARQVNQTPAGFVPRQQEAQQLPSSLSGFGELNPDQQQSNLANQGTYGGGLGPQENSYFLNLINRQLVDKSGQVASSSNINPISKSYLQKLGFGGYGDSNSLLEAISKWKAA